MTAEEHTKEKRKRLVWTAKEKLVTAIFHTGDYQDDEIEELVEEALWDILSAAGCEKDRIFEERSMEMTREEVYDKCVEKIYPSLEAFGGGVCIGKQLLPREAIDAIIDCAVEEAQKKNKEKQKTKEDKTT